MQNTYQKEFEAVVAQKAQHAPEHFTTLQKRVYALVCVADALELRGKKEHLQALATLELQARNVIDDEGVLVTQDALLVEAEECATDGRS